MPVYYYQCTAHGRTEHISETGSTVVWWVDRTPQVIKGVSSGFSECACSPCAHAQFQPHIQFINVSRYLSGDN